MAITVGEQQCQASVVLIFNLSLVLFFGSHFTNHNTPHTYEHFRTRYNVETTHPHRHNISSVTFDIQRPDA